MLLSILRSCFYTATPAVYHSYKARVQHNFDNVPTVVADVVTPEGGRIVRWKIIVELRLIDKDSNERSDWIPERTLLREGQCMRLSGASIQRQLYYATAPSHQQL